jgi:hypothetical protein
MKNLNEKERLESIKTLFTVIMKASEIIKAIDGNHDFIVVEHSAKGIIEYINTDEATAEGALELIADHVAMLVRRFDLPDVSVIGMNQEGYKTIAEVKENEIVLDKTWNDAGLKIYKGLESKLIDHDIRDIKRLVEKESKKKKEFDPERDCCSGDNCCSIYCAD